MSRPETEAEARLHIPICVLIYWLSDIRTRRFNTSNSKVILGQLHPPLVTKANITTLQRTGNVEVKLHAFQNSLLNVGGVVSITPGE